MPALPAVPKVIRFQFLQNIGTDLHVLNTLYYLGAGAATTSDVQNACEAAADAWESNVLVLQTSDVVFVECVATALDSASAPQATVIENTVGSVGGTILPAGTAMVISKKVARRFRGGHGRLYLCGLNEGTLQNAQTFNGSALNSVQTAFTALDTAIKGASYSAWTSPVGVVVRYFQGFTVVTNPITHRARNVPNPIPGGPTTDTILSLTPSFKVASQRRRNLQSS
jgi:hypothetical protein